MMYYYLLYFFIAVGAKLLLALLMIYLLLPSDRRCSRCDEETVLLRAGRFGRGIRLLLGRVQVRWCPRCHWQGLARRGSDPLTPGGISLGTTTPTRHG